MRIKFRLILCLGLVCNLFVETMSAQKEGLLVPQDDRILNIKIPQLFGIIAGCIVFISTISTVIFLLYRSGTFSRLQEEIHSGQPLTINLKASSHLASFPELYDSLLLASKSLPLRPNPPDFSGSLIKLRPWKEHDIQCLHNASNGLPLFNESAYEPERIWGWIDIDVMDSSIEYSTAEPTTSIPIIPWESEKSLQTWLQLKDSDISSLQMVMLDPKLDRPVGMVRLNNNSPKNLSINIDWVWITPACQGLRYGHESLLLLLQWLISSGYRRVTCEVDSRHMIMKKFLERFGFRLEAVLHKHRIVCRRNRDTAVYVILNSDWPETEFKLKKFLCIPIKRVHKIAEIASAKEVLGPSVAVAVTSGMVAGVVPDTDLGGSESKKKRK